MTLSLTREGVLALCAALESEMVSWDTECQHGHCMAACDQFVSLLEGLGVPCAIRVWERDGVYAWPCPGIDLVQPFPWQWGVFTCHYVVQVGGWLVDWTARQFHAAAPFPALYRLEREPPLATFHSEGPHP